MATTQKRGFRLPWGSDPRRDELPTDDQAGGGSPAVPNRSTDLGAGPFGVAGTVDAGSTMSTAQPGADTGVTPSVTRDDAAEITKRVSWPTNDRRTAGPLSGEARLPSIVRAAVAPGAAIADAPAADDAAADEAESPAPAADEAESPALRPAEATAEAPFEAEAEAAADDTDGSDQVEVEVVSDARIQALTLEAPATEAMAMPTVEAEREAEMSSHATGLPEDARTDVAQPAAGMTAGVRRDNPLVAGLVRAMRQAASAARDEVLATFRVDAEARAGAMQAESTAATEGLRKAADADIAAIKEWSRAELARVREETEARIADRKTRLVEETDFEATDLQERLSDLRATVERFEADMAAFFEMLLAEGDPARLAGLAESMPSPPAIAGQPAGEFEPVPSAEIDEPTRETAPPGEDAPATEETRPAEEPAEEALAPEEAPAAEETRPAEDAPAAEETPRGDEPAASEWSWPSDEPATADTASGESLDPDTAAAAEAEARVGLDVQTHVVVSGLSSVASIAAFKAALVHGTGVSAVSVTAGTNGEVLYTVTHDGRVDFREVLASMAAFDARVVSDEGSTLSVTAREPAA